MLDVPGRFAVDVADKLAAVAVAGSIAVAVVADKLEQPVAAVGTAGVVAAAGSIAAVAVAAVVVEPGTGEVGIVVQHSVVVQPSPSRPFGLVRQERMGFGFGFDHDRAGMGRCKAQGRRSRLAVPLRSRVEQPLEL